MKKSNIDDEDELLSVKKTKVILDVSEKTVRRLIKRKELEAIRIGAQLRIRRSRLEQYLRAHTV